MRRRRRRRVDHSRVCASARQRLDRLCDGGVIEDGERCREGKKKTVSKISRAGRKGKEVAPRTVSSWSVGLLAFDAELVLDVRFCKAERTKEEDGKSQLRCSQRGTRGRHTFFQTLCTDVLPRTLDDDVVPELTVRESFAGRRSSLTFDFFFRPTKLPDKGTVRSAYTREGKTKRDIPAP